MSSTLYKPLFDEDQISASNVFVNRVVVITVCFFSSSSSSYSLSDNTHVSGKELIVGGKSIFGLDLEGKNKRS